jgi:hypothetical protein
MIEFKIKYNFNDHPDILLNLELESDKVQKPTVLLMGAWDLFKKELQMFDYRLTLLSPNKFFDRIIYPFIQALSKLYYVVSLPKDRERLQNALRSTMIWCIHYKNEHVFDALLKLLQKPQMQILYPNFMSIPLYMFEHGNYYHHDIYSENNSMFQDFCRYIERNIQDQKFFYLTSSYSLLSYCNYKITMDVNTYGRNFKPILTLTTFGYCLQRKWIKGAKMCLELYPKFLSRYQIFSCIMLKNDCLAEVLEETNYPFKDEVTILDCKDKKTLALDLYYWSGICLSGPMFIYMFKHLIENNIFCEPITSFLDQAHLEHKIEFDPEYWTKHYGSLCRTGKPSTVGRHIIRFRKQILTFLDKYKNDLVYKQQREERYKTFYSYFDGIKLSPDWIFEIFKYYTVIVDDRFIREVEAFDIYSRMSLF